MLSEDKYFQDLTKAELWQRYCGFLNLTVDEFMQIQQDLLMDQLKRVANSKLGKKILGNKIPGTVEEFRQTVPLTRYEDYEPYLSEQQVDALAIEPATWCHSSGKGGKFKWFPLSSEFVHKIAKNAIATFILSTARTNGEINISPGVRVMLILAPPPYGSGIMLQATSQYFTMVKLPDLDKLPDVPFSERIQLGLQMALRQGVDIIGSLPSILTMMGQESGNRKKRFSKSMLSPQVLYRLSRAIIQSKKEGRQILPMDLWPAKSIIAGGMDTHIYSDSIKHYWGMKPYEFYISSEAFYIATHGWNKRWLTFIPDMVFLEFIPMDELRKEKEDKDYVPKTVLLNEVKEGQLYELVISHFYGMPLLRYRIRDIIKIAALKDEVSHVNLPQMLFQRRVDEAINIGGLAQLDEKTIWQAMTNISLEFVEWAAFKEFDQDTSYLHILVEPKSTDSRTRTELAKSIDEQLRIIDTDYKDIDYYLGMVPVRITLLSNGTFQRYIEEKIKEGVDRAHIKPAHISPPQTTVQRLLDISNLKQ
ncbi:GH3 auxin-responsive promoter family protein [Chloroflexota bacterium]